MAPIGAGPGSPHIFTDASSRGRRIDRLDGFHIILAASGMCEAGRIRYRLKNWLWRDDATVLLVGYQAQGTLGRILQDGAAAVRIQGEDITVRARILSIDLYSGHADGPELAAWLKERLPIRSQVFPRALRTARHRRLARSAGEYSSGRPDRHSGDR